MAGILAQILDELPFMLPEGYSYVSAFFTAVLDEGENSRSPPRNPDLTVRFRVPGEAGSRMKTLTILCWDGAGMGKSGWRISEDGYYFQVTTEETGVFGSGHIQ